MDGKEQTVEGKSAPKRREELVAVAARLFHDQGYDATSMQDVADQMGMLKGSVYHYVRTKEDLLWMVVEPQLIELVDTAKAVFADVAVPLPERLRLALEAHARSFERNYPHMFVITRENGETLSSTRHKSFDRLRSRYFKLWFDAVVDGQASGELRADLDPRIVVQAIFGMLNWMFRWFKPGGKSTAEEVARTFSALLSDGLVVEG
jgi:AcrR family transcriptional regulator